MGTVIMLRSSYAQLANHLHPFAAAYAWCLEQGHEFRTPGFSRYARYFKHLGGGGGGGGRGLAGSAAAQAVGWRLTRWGQKSRLLGPTLVAPPNGPVTLLPPSAPMPSAWSGKGRVYLQGWRFRNPVGIATHRGAILERFAPADDVARAVDEFYRGVASDRLRIAVHIRHTDFRTHAGGKYFVPLERTLAAAREAGERYRALRPLFVIFSDEPRSAEEFAGVDHMISRGNAGEDLFRMARCQAIIGPKSSFNMWAGWWGGGAVLHLAGRGEAADAHGGAGMVDPAGADESMEGLATFDALDAALRARGHAF
jgi:hypothetical protein